MLARGRIARQGQARQGLRRGREGLGEDEGVGRFDLGAREGLGRQLDRAMQPVDEGDRAGDGEAADQHRVRRDRPP